MTTRKERLKNYLEFLWVMTEKEIKARYKRAVFGFLWVILNPILQMVIIGAIFYKKTKLFFVSFYQSFSMAVFFFIFVKSNSKYCR